MWFIVLDHRQEKVVNAITMMNQVLLNLGALMSPYAGNDTGIVFSSQSDKLSLMLQCKFIIYFDIFITVKTELGHIFCGP